MDGWPSGVVDGNSISLFDIVFCLNLNVWPSQTGRFILLFSLSKTVQPSGAISQDPGYLSS